MTTRFAKWSKEREAVRVAKVAANDADAPAVA